MQPDTIDRLAIINTKFVIFQVEMPSTPVQAYSVSFKDKITNYINAKSSIGLDELLQLRLRYFFCIDSYRFVVYIYG